MLLSLIVPEQGKITFLRLAIIQCLSSNNNKKKSSYICIPFLLSNCFVANDHRFLEKSGKESYFM